jgi:predicted RND superfamily exporter protein
VSERFALFVYRWRWLLTAVAVAGAVAFAPRLAIIASIDNDITAWFSREDPVFKEYERFREEFGGTRSLIVALQTSDGSSFFTDGRLEFLDAVTSDIERIPLVQQAQSLTNANIVSGDGELLQVRPLHEIHERDGIDAARRVAMRDELIRGDLISDNEQVAAIIVTFDEDRVDDVRGRVIESVRQTVLAKLPAGVTPHFNGSLEISETYNRVTLANTQTFTPPIMLFTFAAVYLMFRSWRRTLLTMGAVLVSVLWTLGLYTAFGFNYNVLTSMLVPLVIVLAIADDVHIMQHFEHERRRHDAEGAFKATVRHLLAPILGASATTALGMLSLATSDVVAVREFGIGSAVGIMVDCAISLVLMPTMLSWMRPETTRVSPHERHLIGPMRRIARFSAGRPALVVSLAAVVGAFAIAGMGRLYVDTNHINFFSRSHPLSTSADVIDRELSGIYSFNILLEDSVADRQALRTPDALGRMERVAGELASLPYVRKVTSVADYVKRIHRELTDGRPESAVIPDDRRAVAQELFVFTLSDRGRTELERVLSSDFSRAQITVKLASMSSDLVFEQIGKAEQIARAAFAGTGIDVTVTGSGRLFAQLDHYLVTSQVSSFGTAFVTVFGVIFLVFRSARFGLLAVVPNLFPVLAVLGMMGWLDISLNVATVMVASVALGVVDDDTIHFINRFRRERGAGVPVDAAIEAATIYEGRAALTTAIINSAGYGVLMLSEYRPTAWFGGLLAVTMAVAFLAEVFVLPATIKLVRGFQGEGRTASRVEGLGSGVPQVGGPVPGLGSGPGSGVVGPGSRVP